MKQILSLLLCYVLLSAETFAMRGWGTGNGGRPLSGSYAAILTQTSEAYGIDPVTFVATPLGYIGTSTGLVLVNVPSVGSARGSFLIFDFDGGDTYFGNLRGLNNVSSGKLIAIMAGLRANDTSPIPDTVSGMLTAAASVGGVGVQEISGTATTRTSRYVGGFIGGGVPTTYSVSGYQQSSGQSVPEDFSDIAKAAAQTATTL